jgi:hypothetical protein
MVGNGAKSLGIEKMGFLVGFADGEVWFLNRQTPVATLRSLCTLDGAANGDGEVLLEPYCISRWRTI